MKVGAIQQAALGWSLAIALALLPAVAAGQDAAPPVAPGASDEAVDPELQRYREQIRRHFVLGEYQQVIELADQIRNQFPNDEAVSFYLSQAQARLADASEELPFSRIRDRRPVNIPAVGAPVQPVTPPLSTPVPAEPVDEEAAGPVAAEEPTAAEPAAGAVEAEIEPAEPQSPAGEAPAPAAAPPVEPAPAPEPQAPPVLTGFTGGMAAYAVIGLAIFAFIIAIVMLVRRRKTRRVLEEMDRDQVGVDWAAAGGSAPGAAAAFAADHEDFGAADPFADQSASPATEAVAPPAAPEPEEAAPNPFAAAGDMPPPPKAEFTDFVSAEDQRRMADHREAAPEDFSEAFWTEDEVAEEEQKPEESTGGLELEDEAPVSLTDESSTSAFDFGSEESGAEAAGSSASALGDAPITPEDLEQAAAASMLDESEDDEEGGFRSEATLENLGEAPVAPEMEQFFAPEGEAAEADLPSMVPTGLDDKALQDTSGIDLFPEDDSNLGLGDTQLEPPPDMEQPEGSQIDFGDLSAGASEVVEPAAEAEAFPAPPESIDVSAEAPVESATPPLAEEPVDAEAEEDLPAFAEQEPETDPFEEAEPKGFDSELETPEDSFDPDLIFSDVQDSDLESAEVGSEEPAPEPFEEPAAEAAPPADEAVDTEQVKPVELSPTDELEPSTRTSIDFTGVASTDQDEELETLDSPRGEGGDDYEGLEDDDFLQSFHDDETVALDVADKEPEETLTGPTRGSITAKDETISTGGGGKLSRLQFDPFEKARNLGAEAFDSEEWDLAIHHLSIAAALRPEAHEVKDLLRKARRKRKESRSTPEG